MTKPLHERASDADFVADVVKQLMSVPASYRLNGFDIACLTDLSSRLRKTEQNSAVLDKPARVGNAVFRAGIAVQTVISAAQRAFDRAEAEPDHTIAWATLPRTPGGLRWVTDIPGQPEQWRADGYVVVPLVENAPPQDISTAPANTDVLVWWPLVKLDDYGDPTEEVVGGRWLISEENGGFWVEPDCMNAIGDHMGDDHTYADKPSHWLPLPAALFTEEVGDQQDD